MKKYTLILALLALISLPFTTHANVYPLPIVTCYFTNVDMTLGSTDVSTGSQVTVLQSFMVSKGFLVMPIGVPMGYFGYLTQAAVAKYQASVSISPAVGYFGPITRGYINSHCNVGTGVSVTSLSPTTGPVGSQVTIYGSGFSSTGNTVNFGNGIVQNLSSTNTTSITFTVPSGINPPCYYSNPPCMIITQITAPGNYNVSVTNASGVRSNEMTFTVTLGQVNTPIINSITPPSAYVGSSVTIHGSGLTSNNKIKFGSYTAATVSSSDGVNATFMVPTSLSNCTAEYCTMVYIPVNSGTYAVSVENENGASNSMNFTVTGSTGTY